MNKPFVKFGAITEGPNLNEQNRPRRCHLTIVSEPKNIRGNLHTFLDSGLRRPVYSESDVDQMQLEISRKILTFQKKKPPLGVRH